MVSERVKTEISDLVARRDFSEATTRLESELRSLRSSATFIGLTAGQNSSIDVTYSTAGAEAELTFGFMAYEAYVKAKRDRYPHAERLLQIASSAGYHTTPITHWVNRQLGGPVILFSSYS